jgi:hypothetical protein
MYSPELHVPDGEQRESVSKDGFQSCRQPSCVKETAPQKPEERQRQESRGSFADPITALSLVLKDGEHGNGATFTLYTCQEV